ncbi:MAG TPA: N-acetylmuramoyl-L-alanine amidase [bacterium]|nr:N-acetylmuramoyl-L-alanine amidase [bacterium]
MRPTLPTRFAAVALLLGAAAPAFTQEPPRARSPQDSAPVINIVYPPRDQVIAPVDSTFVIGSVTPGAKLTINGQPIDVYRTGGFLAWVNVEPGDFVFRLRARNKFGADSLDLPVRITDNRPIPPEEGARIRDGSARPIWNRTIRPGDEVPVSFDGTMGGTARFWIIAKRDTTGPFPMTELRARSLSSFEAYRRDEIANQSPLLTGGPTPSRGRYHGIWTAPEKLDNDTLAVMFELLVASPKAGSARATATGLLIPVHHLPPRVVELIDSIQILRTGPRMGYFAINQPYGVRARWWGTNGPWTIVQPAPGLEAWIETEKMRLLPEGTPIPEAVIPRLNTVATDSSVRLEVGMSERLPFKVAVDDDLRGASITLYGAISNTDWIERDSVDDLFADIAWAQPEPKIYRIDVELTEPLWGYDTRYEDSRFVFEVYRSPLRDSTLDGLTICVDPGHSADPGSVGPTGLVEKDANLKIARALVAQLQAMGAQVIMTRTGNEDVPLAQRPGIAFNGGADIYVSVHNNAVPDGVDPRRRNGTSVYYHHPHSRALATAVHRRTRAATGLADYGLTQANFAVIRPPQYPSVLVECAFIILPEQEEMLDNDAFTTRTAHGIADGILEFVRERFRVRRSD